MAFTEYVGVPGAGKTTCVKKALWENKALRAGRRSLIVNREKGARFIGLSEMTPFFPRLAFFFVVDMYLSTRFFFALRASFKERSIRSCVLLSILVRSRLFNYSNEDWVVDQGVFQHIQSCLAKGFLCSRKAIFWCEFFARSPMYAPAKLVVIHVDSKTLLSRLRSSPKHIIQSGKVNIEKYATLHLQAFDLLFSGDLKWSENLNVLRGSDGD